MSLPKPCLEPYCGETVTEHSRCPEHRRGQEAHRRERRGPRPYDKRAWRDRIRPRQLRREPLCRFCAMAGKTEPATEVDHIDGDNTNHDPSNLRSLCKPCHTGRTSREQVHGSG